jgi:hypothetical protein
MLCLCYLSWSIFCVFSLLHGEMNTLHCFLNVAYGKEVINGWKIYPPPFVIMGSLSVCGAWGGSATCYVSPCCNTARDRDGKLFQSRVKCTARLQPNLHWFWRMGWGDCNVRCLSHPADMRGEIESRKCFGLKCKVPFISAQFRLNFHWL